MRIMIFMFAQNLSLQLFYLGALYVILISNEVLCVNTM